MSDLSSYVSALGKAYVPPARIGYTAIKVLPQLWGRPLDVIAMGYIHALRPSYIRAVTGEETTDAICWRVTIYVEHEVIAKITQEVEVGLPDDFENGWMLRQALRKVSDE